MISCVTISRSAGLARNAQTPWRSGGIAVSFIAELKKMGEISETVTRKIAAASCEFDRRASVKKSCAISSSTSARCSMSSPHLFVVSSRTDTGIESDSMTSTLSWSHGLELLVGKDNAHPFLPFVIYSLTPHKVNDTLQFIFHANGNVNCSSRYTNLYPDLIDRSPWVRALSTSVLLEESRTSWENERTYPSC